MSMGTVGEDHTGFQLFVGDRAEFPVMKERSLLVRPGQETLLEVSGYVVKSAENTRCGGGRSHPAQEHRAEGPGVPVSRGGRTGPLQQILLRQVLPSTLQDTVSTAASLSV